MAKITDYIETDYEGEEDIDVEESSIHELNGKMIHVRVGNDQWDSDTVSKEIEKVREDLQKLIIEENGLNCLIYVTHKFVDIRRV